MKISETTPFCKITEKLTEESNHFEEHITTEKLDRNTKKAIVNLSFGHKAVISSLNKLNIESKKEPQIWTRNKRLIKWKNLDNGVTIRD